jgi:hypothetical protein
MASSAGAVMGSIAQSINAPNSIDKSRFDFFIFFSSLKSYI